MVDLLIPDGLNLDVLTARHLARRLVDEGADAVLAEPVSVAAGSSARVMAERALAVGTPEPNLQAATGTRLRAAGVTRTSGGAVVDGRSVRLVSDQVFVDPGAVSVALEPAHGPFVDASHHGRPVFTRRPVVVVALGHGVSDDEAQWAMALADGLLGHDIEARLAFETRVAVPGGGLTTPCALSSATMAALRPDVVMTVGDEVKRRVEPWCTERYTTIIEVVADRHGRSELVSWRHGQAQGRVRARIGPQVPGAELAALVTRLCGGPPPVLPAGIDELVDRPEPAAVAVRSTVRRRPAGPVRSVALVGAPDGELDGRRWAGVAEQFELIGCTVTTDDAGTAMLDQTDLVLCGSNLSGGLWDALAGRRRRGARIGALISHRDVQVDGEATTSLSASATAVMKMAGRALVPSAVVESLGSPDGARTARHLPTVVRGERIAKLEREGISRPAGTEAVLGWIIEPGADPTPHLGEVLSWLDANPSAAMVVANAGDASSDLADLVDHHRVTTVVAIDAADAAGWLGLVWSPTPGRAAGAGEILPVVELALAGVPVFATDTDRAALGGLGELVAAPSARILALGANEARNRGRRLHDRAASLHGAQSAAVRAHRVLGWLLAESAS